MAWVLTALSDVLFHLLAPSVKAQRGWTMAAEVWEGIRPPRRGCESRYTLYTTDYFSSDVIFCFLLTVRLPQMWFELVGTSAFLQQQWGTSLKAANYTSLALEDLYIKLNCPLVPSEFSLFPLVTLPKWTSLTKYMCNFLSLVYSLLLGIIGAEPSSTRNESLGALGKQEHKCTKKTVDVLFFVIIIAAFKQVLVILLIPKCFVLLSPISKR